MEAAPAPTGAGARSAHDQPWSIFLRFLRFGALAWGGPAAQIAIKAPLELERQVFEAFELRIVYDKLERRIEISATVSKAVTDAFGNAEALRLEGLGCLGSDLSVATGDIAGARYVPRGYPRIVERVAA